MAKKAIDLQGLSQELAAALTAVPEQPLPEPVRDYDRLRLAVAAGILVERLMGKKISQSTHQDRSEFFCTIVAARLIQAKKRVTSVAIGKELDLSRQTVSKSLKPKAA